MKRVFGLATVALGLTLSTAALADGAANPAVKARHAQMQLYAFNIGQLGAMAKGAVDYNAEAAQAAADNIVTLSSLHPGAMWPEGTDSMSVDGSRAKPAMWENFPDVMTKVEALNAAASGMQAAAGKSLDDLRAAIGPLGGACGGCHKAYREPES